MNLKIASGIITTIILLGLALNCFAAESLEERLYFEAEEAYLKADYENACVLCSRLSDLYPASKVLPDALYLKGLCLLKTGFYTEARSNFEKVLSDHHRSDIYCDALLAYGDTFMLDNKLDLAHSSYQKLLKEYPKSSLSAQTMFRLGQISRKKGSWAEAKSIYEKILAKYPNTVEAKNSKDIMTENEFYFTIQVGSFSDRLNAQRLCDDLSLKGYNSYTQEYKTEITSFYRVKVGRFDKMQDAAILEAKLKSEGLPTQIIP